MIMLVLGMILVTPAMACPAGADCGNTSLSGDQIRLAGEEEDKVIDMAMKNSQVKELQSQLKDEGFTQKDPEAFIVPVKAEDGSLIENKVVILRFESSSVEVAEQVITFVYNPETGGTVVIQGAGWDCTLCASAIAACGVCAASCTAINAGCILCLGAACPAALYQCTVCCCSLGNQWCCDRLEW